ncbi:DUF1353 domain-containing protein [Rhodovibrionaceae bacterium A322]
MPAYPGYTPEFPDPYPDRQWKHITDVRYETDLILRRNIQDVINRTGENGEFLVGEEYRISYKLDGEDRQLTVPKGLLTDLASIPAPVRSLISESGPHLEASVVHDFLYVAWQDLPSNTARAADRRFADRLMKASMEAANVKPDSLSTIYNFVRWGGRFAYNDRNPEPRYVKWW